MRMRTPRQWYREELDSKDGMNIALAFIVSACGWVTDDSIARAIYTVAALAILRGKL